MIQRISSRIKRLWREKPAPKIEKGKCGGPRMSEARSIGVFAPLDESFARSRTMQRRSYRFVRLAGFPFSVET